MNLANLNALLMSVSLLDFSGSESKSTPLEGSSGSSLVLSDLFPPDLVPVFLPEAFLDPWGLLLAGSGCLEVEGL